MLARLARVNSVRRDLRERGALLITAFAVIAGVGLALIWVWLVPIYQAPDETSHFKYVAGIYAAGRLIVPREDPAAYPIPAGRIIPYPVPLEDLTGVAALAGKSYLKAPPGYGSTAYYQELDARLAATPEPRQSLLNPILVRYYPVGYYALDAIWMGAASLLIHSASGLFFAARTLSCILLGFSLVLGYLVLRQLGVVQRRAAAITVVMALLPMTTMVSSAVQPDSLSFALVSASLYCGLRYRRDRTGYHWCALLGLGTGLLLLTKLQYWIPLAAAAAGVLVARWLIGRTWNWRRFASELGLLVAPTGGAVGLQYWLLYHASLVVERNDVKTVSSARDALLGGPLRSAAFAATQTWYLFRDFAFGRLFFSFWGILGWLDTLVVIWSEPLTILILLILAAFAVVTLSLVLVRQARVVVRLGRLTGNRSWRRAIALAFGNPVITAFGAFIGLMLVYEDAGGIQGRYFLPFLPALFYVSFQIAPKAIPRRPGHAYRTLLMGATLGFALLSACFALPTLEERFYGNGRALQPLNPALTQVDTPGLYRISRIGTPSPRLGIDTPPLRVVGVSGWAIDPIAHSLASTVLIRIDDLPPQEAVYGDNSPAAVAFLHDDRFRRAGFDLLVQVGDLEPGPHVAAVLVVSADGKSLYSAGPPVRFQMPAPAPAAG